MIVNQYSVFFTAKEKDRNERDSIVVGIVGACENAGVRYELKKMKSGFVVCFYRSEKKPIKADKNQNKNLLFSKNFSKFTQALDKQCKMQ